MNLFILFADPRLAAQAHVDKHVVKMILEACQMLYSAHWTTTFPNLQLVKSAVAISRAQKDLPLPPIMELAPFRVNKIDRGYRPVHLHHPCTKWVRASLQNYLWTCQLAKEIGTEFTHRYGGLHACAAHAEWLLANPPVLPDIGQTPFVIAMKPEFRCTDDAIECYRHYYRESKGDRGLLIYTRRSAPAWLKDGNCSKEQDESEPA